MDAKFDWWKIDPVNGGPTLAVIQGPVVAAVHAAEAVGAQEVAPDLAPGLEVVATRDIILAQGLAPGLVRSQGKENLVPAGLGPSLANQNLVLAHRSLVLAQPSINLNPAQPSVNPNLALVQPIVNPNLVPRVSLR